MSDEFEALIFRLPTPVICKSSEINNLIKTSFDGHPIRVYPPFMLNYSEEKTGSFKNAWIPEGDSKLKLNCYRLFPSSTPTGLTADPVLQKNTFYCQGLRVDVTKRTQPHLFIRLFLDLVCQYTNQWWLRSDSSPFNGMTRFKVQLNNEYELAEEFRYAGAGEIKGTWHPFSEHQSFLGLEHPLDNELWNRIQSNLTHSRKADAGFLALYDALAAYMSYQDEQCVLNLCICVEILCNKRLLLLGRKSAPLNKLIAKTDLADDKTKVILKKLLIDRGHVAHGRSPHVLSDNKDVTIEKYIDATSNLVRSYNEKLKPGEWPTAQMLDIKRKPKTPSGK